MGTRNFRRKPDKSRENGGNKKDNDKTKKYLLKGVSVWERGSTI